MINQKYHLYNLKTKQDYYKTRTEMVKEFGMGAGAYFLTQGKYMSCKGHTLYENRNKPTGYDIKRRTRVDCYIYHVKHEDGTEKEMTYNTIRDDLGLGKKTSDFTNGKLKKCKGYTLVSKYVKENSRVYPPVKQIYHIINPMTKEEHKMTIKQMIEVLGMTNPCYLTNETMKSYYGFVLYKNKDKPYGNKSNTKIKTIYQLENLVTSEIVTMTHHEFIHEYCIDRGLLNGKYKTSKGYKLVGVIEP